MAGPYSRRRPGFGCRIICCTAGSQEEDDEPNSLDVSRSRLSEVPSEVLACERTLESLNLDHNHIGELPRQLFTCDELRSLSVSDNELIYIPPAISYLRNLQRLNASRNLISTLPDNIRQCRNLISLDLSINPLEKLPENLVNIHSLQELLLNDVYLEFLPANFGKLVNLRMLELRENGLSSLPKTMNRLVNLAKLDLGANEFQELPEVVTMLNNLSELLIDGNNIKRLNPSIGRLRKLTHFDASRNGLETLPREIGYWTRIDEIHLLQNDLTTLPSTIGNLKNLVLMKLDHNKLTTLPESIGKLTMLQELSLMDNCLTHLPASIGLLRGLRYLYCDKNQLMELPPELGSCLSLRILSLRSNKLIEIPDEIGHLYNLTMFNVINNYIKNLPISFVNLINLNSMWIAENQSIPLASLTADVDQETEKTILSCFMLPQQRTPSEIVSASSSNDPPRSRSVAFAPTAGTLEQPGRLSRAPTPYPKELRAMSKHARNVNRALAQQRSAYTVPGPSRIREATVNVVPPSIASGEPISRSIDLSSEPIPLQDVIRTPDSSASMSSLPIAYESSPIIREARNIRTDVQSVSTPTPPSPQRVPPPYHIAAAYSTQAHFFQSDSTGSDMTRVSTPSLPLKREGTPKLKLRKNKVEPVSSEPTTDETTTYESGDLNIRTTAPTIGESTEKTLTSGPKSLDKTSGDTTTSMYSGATIGVISEPRSSDRYRYSTTSPYPATTEMTTPESTDVTSTDDSSYSFKLLSPPSQVAQNPQLATIREDRTPDSDPIARSVECDMGSDQTERYVPSSLTKSSTRTSEYPTDRPTESTTDSTPVASRDMSKKVNFPKSTQTIPSSGSQSSHYAPDMSQSMTARQMLSHPFGVQEDVYPAAAGNGEYPLSNQNSQSTGFGIQSSEVLSSNEVSGASMHSLIPQQATRSSLSLVSNYSLADEVQQPSAQSSRLQTRYMQRGMMPYGPRSIPLTYSTHPRNRESLGIPSSRSEGYNLNETYTRSHLDNDNVTSGDSENNLTPEPRCFVQNIPGSGQNIVIPTPQRPSVDRSPHLTYLGTPTATLSISASSPQVAIASNVTPVRETASDTIITGGATRKAKPVTPQSSRMKWVFGQHKNATVLNVVIQKTPDLGFSFTEVPGKGIFIDDASGQENLSVGDKILEVEGIDVTNMSKEEVMEILLAGGRSISMMISHT